VGILIDRRGYIQQVVIGDAKQILLPQQKRARSSSERLSGSRYIHTHLLGERLNEDDLSDLSLLRFDCIIALEVKEDGLSNRVHMATINPDTTSDKPWLIYDPLSPADISALDFQEMIRELEKEIARQTPLSVKISDTPGKERVLLVGVVTKSISESEASMEELKALATSCGVSVQGTVLQRRPAIHPQFVVGKGKLKDLVIKALQNGAEMIIFDHDLTPTQMRAITDYTELKVLDRTQLILDIFAQRAKSRDGKVQVELAQLRYRLPRLIHRNTGLSRLAGGIGGIGPGETKLEIDRRRVRDRIHRLEKEIETLRRGRKIRRTRRARREIPLICLVGYTNAGKSTLLNALTRSVVLTENRLFATLDTATRRIRLNDSQEALIVDTVGFIRNLPHDLIAAFRATLEELEDADLLINVIDGASDASEKQITVVDSILESLDLDSIPQLKVFNKSDRADPIQLENVCHRYQGIPACALDPKSLDPLRQRIESLLFQKNGLITKQEKIL